MEWPLRAKPGVATYVRPALSMMPGATLFLDQRRNKDVFAFHGGRRDGWAGHIFRSVWLFIEGQLDEHGGRDHVYRLGGRERARNQHHHEDRFGDRECNGERNFAGLGKRHPFRHRNHQSRRYGDTRATHRYACASDRDACPSDGHSSTAHANANTGEP